MMDSIISETKEAFEVLSKRWRQLIRKRYFCFTKGLYKQQWQLRHRDIGLIEVSLNRALQTFDGRDLYKVELYLERELKW